MLFLSKPKFSFNTWPIKLQIAKVNILSEYSEIIADALICSHARKLSLTFCFYFCGHPENSLRLENLHLTQTQEANYCVNFNFP